MVGQHAGDQPGFLTEAGMRASCRTRTALSVPASTVADHRRATMPP